MFKISKDFVSIRDLQKLKEELIKIDNKSREKFNALDKKLEKKVKTIDDKLKEQIINLDHKLEEQIAYLNHKLEEKINTLDNELMEQVHKIENKIKTLTIDIQTNKNNTFSNHQEIQENLKTQEEIIIDKINKFKEEYKKDKNEINTEMEELKNQQDILSISYTVNDKQLLEKLQGMIANQLRMACADKELEILMTMWIKELREIISNFEKLKKMHPKDFNLQIQQIANTIKSFKQKLAK